MSKSNNKYVNDFLNSNYYAIFICHRRVTTVLYKRYDLTGYEIELLLTIGKLCDFSIDTEIVGSKIREKCSKRFETVLGSMLKKLVERGFINDRRKDNASKQSWHYISLTELGIGFIDIWDKTLKSLVQEEKDQLIISISNTQKRDKNKSKVYSRAKKNNKGLPPAPTE